MKISAVQFKPLAGDIDANIKRHIEFIEIAVIEGANLIYFPELSITGYEPKLAKSLAAVLSDAAFGVFQNLSDTHNVIIGIGAPLSAKGQVQIGMIWFEPNQPRSTYAKQLLHSDETPFFISGDRQFILQAGGYRFAPAICYESLQSGHSDKAAGIGANVYLASVAKSAGGIEKAMQHYPETAKKHHMYVVMANCIGPCDDFMSVGESAAWDRNGKLLAQMEGNSEGILMVDVESDNAVIRKA
jgi:predicted amidohydrolase